MLRFVAAFLVLIEHLLQAFERGYVDSGALVSPVPILWRSGVDIFFVISGFIMLYVTVNQFGGVASAKDFLVRRIVRIVPLYWLFTTLAVAAMIALPDRVNNAAIDPAHVGLSYLFIPWPRADGAVQPPLGPGWTLNYEMFFYVIFAVGLCFRRTMGLMLVALAFILAIVLGRLAGPALGPFAFWTQPMILEFLFGIALAALYLRGVRLRPFARIALVLAGLALGGYAELHSFSFASRWLWAGVPSLLIAAGVVLGPEPRDFPLRRWLVLGGGASYALYLSHLFSLKAVGIVWQKLGIDSSLGFLLVAGAVAIVAAVLVHLFVEKPMLRASHRLFVRQPVKSPVVSTPTTSV